MKTSRFSETQIITILKQARWRDQSCAGSMGLRLITTGKPSSEESQTSQGGRERIDEAQVYADLALENRKDLIEKKL